MKVLFFGRMSERIGRETVLDLPADVRTVAQLKRLLAAMHPQAEADFLGPTLRACVDDMVVPDDSPLAEDSEVAFLPPLSGG